MYTTRVLGREKSAGAGAQDSYTVPTGHTLVLRCVTVKFVSTGDHLYIGRGTSNYLVLLASTGALTWQQWEGRMAFEAGETLVIDLSAGQIGYQATGYLLTA